MQSTGWIDLLRLIPAEQQQNLLIMTAIGDQIAVQDIVRLTEDYVLVRGRLGGTNDADRAFFIPYDRIVYVGYHKSVAEHQLYGLYGLTPPERVAVPAVPPTEEEKPPEEKPAEGEAVEAKPEPPPSAAANSTPAAGINRAQLLQRIRARAMKAAGIKPASESPRQG